MEICKGVKITDQSLHINPSRCVSRREIVTRIVFPLLRQFCGDAGSERKLILCLSRYVHVAEWNFSRIAWSYVHIRYKLANARRENEASPLLLTWCGTFYIEHRQPRSLRMPFDTVNSPVFALTLRNDSENHSPKTLQYYASQTRIGHWTKYEKVSQPKNII